MSVTIIFIYVNIWSVTSYTQSSCKMDMELQIFRPDLLIHKPHIDHSPQVKPHNILVIHSSISFE